MGKILLILLFFPALLFAQQDSTIKRAFKIGNLKATISGKSNGNIIETELIKAGEIIVRGIENYKITGYSMSILFKWNKMCDTSKSPLPLTAQNGKLSRKMIKAIKGIETDSNGNIVNNCYVVIIRFYDINCMLSNGDTASLNDIEFTLKSK